MSNNRYYYYDEETFSFVELKNDRSRWYKRLVVLLILALPLALLINWGLSGLFKTPQELALEHENEVLQRQLGTVQERMEEFASQLDKLSSSDQNLYRTILKADPISEDVRQVGVGGTDPYEQFSGFSPNTADLLRATAQQLDKLERQVNLQNESYRELAALAEKRDAWLAQMPAILPADGDVVSGHGMRHHPILRVRRMHHGIDVLVSEGSPVYATGGGVIREVGRNSGLGNYVKIEHPATGYTTIYAHLSEVPKEIRRGVNVTRGDLIAFSGNTGLSAAPHLHYEVRDAERRSVNPVFFFLPSLTPEQYNTMLADLEQKVSSLD